VRQAALRFMSAREFIAGSKVQAHRGEGTEFDSLREYLPGLDPRALDWKSSARHRKLLLREHRAERNHQVVMAVDTGYLMSEPLAGIPRLDHAVNAALLLGFAALKTGDRVEPVRVRRAGAAVHRAAQRARAFAQLQQRTPRSTTRGRRRTSRSAWWSSTGGLAAQPGGRAHGLRRHRHRGADDREPGAAGPAPPGAAHDAARPGPRAVADGAPRDLRT
jgi:uncharacterized protein (DUF58 family)